MKNNKLIYIAIILSIISILIYYININHEYILNKYFNINKIDTCYVTDTIRHVDTLTIFKEKPIPKEVILTQIDTFFTPKGDSILLKTENKVYQDTLCNKNDSIILQSYISGINSNLDSIKADWRKSETIITNTIEITKYIEKKKKFWDRFHIQPQVTGGYDVINKQWGVTAGIGVGIDI